MLPDVPTMAEAAAIRVEVGAWFGLLAPAGTPQPVIAWLNRESQQGVRRRPTRATNSSRRAPRMPLGTPEAFRDFIAAQTARFGDVIQRAGIKVE